MNTAIELLIRGAFLCLLAAALLVILRRAAAAYRHLICVLALCAMLTLPLAQQVLPPLPLLPSPTGVVPSEPASVSPRKAPRQPKLSLTPPVVVPRESVTASRNTTFVAPAPVRQGRWNADFALLLVWALGAVTLLARLVAALLRLHRLKAESRETMLGDVPIRVSEQVKTPLTWGVRRSVILLPAALLAGDPAVCDSAMRHEQAHIARWDWIWNLLAEIVCALCWFQIGAWWLRSRMRRESERACDDRVLLSGITGPDYAAHLMAIVRTVDATEVAPAMAHRGGMEERMKHLLDPSRKRRAHRGWLAVSTPLALVFLSIAALRVSARPADAPRAKNTGAAAATMKPAVPSPAVTPAAQEVKNPPPSSNDAPAASAGAAVSPEASDIAWGPGEQVQAGLGVRRWAKNQRAGRFVFDVYLRNRTGKRLRVVCQSFPGLSVPTDAAYTTEVQSDLLYCVPHLRNSRGKPVEVKVRPGNEERSYTLEPGEVVRVSHWLLRTIHARQNDTLRAKNYTQVAFLEAGTYRMTCDVTASWDEGSRRTLRTGEAGFDVTTSEIAAEAPKPNPAPPTPTANPAAPVKGTTTTMVVPQEAPALSAGQLSSVIWGDAVDGLQAGFLLAGSGSPNDARVPINSQVDFTVLVRNTTERALIFEVRHGDADPWNADPYVIPGDTIGEALRSRPLPDRFRARGPRSLALWPGAYFLQLAPGEAVVVPGKKGVYIGEGDRNVYPRIARVKAGMNWIVQPVTVRLLDATEQGQFERIRKTPYKSEWKITLYDRDGRTRRQVLVPLLGARSGGKQLYPRIQLEAATLNAEAARNAVGAAWGETDKGLQCGIRLLSPNRVFRVGDTLEAEILWRNTGSKPLKVFLPRKLDLYPSIYDADGNWREIAFGARFIIRPGSDTLEPGEVRSLGVTAVTLVAGGTPSPKSNAEPGQITLPPGSYTLSGSGGVGNPNPQSGTVGFKVLGAAKTAQR